MSDDEVYDFDDDVSVAGDGISLIKERQPSAQQSSTPQQEKREYGTYDLEKDEERVVGREGKIVVVNYSDENVTIDKVFFSQELLDWLNDSDLDSSGDSRADINTNLTLVRKAILNILKLKQSAMEEKKGMLEKFLAALEIREKDKSLSVEVLKNYIQQKKGDASICMFDSEWKASIAAHTKILEQLIAKNNEFLEQGPECFDDKKNFVVAIDLLDEILFSLKQTDGFDICIIPDFSEHLESRQTEFSSVRDELSLLGYHLKPVVEKERKRFEEGNGGKVEQGKPAVEKERKSFEERINAAEMEQRKLEGVEPSDTNAAEVEPKKTESVKPSDTAGAEVEQKKAENDKSSETNACLIATYDSTFACKFNSRRLGLSHHKHDFSRQKLEEDCAKKRCSRRVDVNRMSQNVVEKNIVDTKNEIEKYEMGIAMLRSQMP